MGSFVTDRCLLNSIFYIQTEKAINLIAFSVCNFILIKRIMEIVSSILEFQFWKLEYEPH